MVRKFLVIGIVAMLAVSTPSCNSSKIPCPTYADSAPQKKSKKKAEPQIPKATKPKSGVLPPGYGKKK